MEISELTVGEIPSLIDICIKTFVQTYCQGVASEQKQEQEQQYLREIFNPTIVLEQLKSGNIQYFLCKINDNIIGYFKLEFIDNKVKLDKFYLLSNYHRMGFGTIMMNYVLDLTYVFNIEEISLIVAQNNQKAINFYKKFGYIITDIAMFQYCNGTAQNWVMSLDLK